MNKTVLVVDDSSTIRKLVTVSLELQGFNVVAACDGMEALEKLPNEKIDLLITDLNMPNMDGFELISTLRKNPDYAGLPVVILSSLSDATTKEQNAALGTVAYLQKPFSPERMRYVISKFLS